MLNKQKRWIVEAQDIGARLHMKDKKLSTQTIQLFHSMPDVEFEIREHISYCFNCISKTLELHQQVCLLLKEVYGFKVAEIMEITALTEGPHQLAIGSGRVHTSHTSFTGALNVLFNVKVRLLASFIFSFLWLFILVL